MKPIDVAIAHIDFDGLIEDFRSRSKIPLEPEFFTVNFVYALHYLKCGLCPIPIRTGKKFPIVRWTNILEDKDGNYIPPTLEDLVTWWKKHPGLSKWEYQIAIIGGAFSQNLIVLDFDGPKKFDLRDEFLKNFPQFVNTCHVTTGGGSPHIWLLGEDLPLDCTKLVIKKDDSAIELRANRHISVVPPSLHKSGGHYEFANDLPINTYSVKDLLQYFGYQKRKKFDVKEFEKIKIRKHGPRRYRIEKLLNEIPIQNVAQKLGLFESCELEEAGLNRWQGNCPTGHSSDSEKCFSIGGPYNAYKCFHFDCKAKGAPIQLVQLVKKCTAQAAKRWLQQQFGEVQL